MAQESKPVVSKEKNYGHRRQDEITPADDEIEEIEIPQKKTLYDKVTQVLEKFASTRMGQAIIERTDRVLKVVEDTAKWSLPQDDKDPQLERPLPWLFFLTLIVWLRVLRIGLSIASLMMGSQRVTPEVMVYYIQIKRRRLRAIRVSGLKSIRSREIESTVMCSGGSGKKVTFVGKLRTLLGSAICKPGQHREAPTRRVFVKDGKDEGSKDMAERSSKRPRDDESVDLNLTVDEMLEKYANEDSDADSDYIPKDDEEEDSTSTSCTSSDAEETETENNQKIDETPKELEKNLETKNDNTSMNQSVVEIKENGGRKNPKMPLPICEIKLEPLSDVDSGNEQVQTPKESTNTNGLGESDQSAESGAAATDAAYTKQDSMNTPKSSLNQLTVPLIEEDKQKSTPGHMTAATLKPTISTTTAAGSPQDFHSIFHPAPIVKGFSADAQSTPKEEETQNENSGAETAAAAPNQKKSFNNANHNKPIHHYNAKNRNKNRR